MAQMTAKQQRFVSEYLKDCNATQAALRAGYSEKSAYSIGQRLLKNVEVKLAVEEEMERLRTENTADSQEVVEYLTSVMRGREKETVPIFVGEGVQELTEKPVGAKDRIKAAELLAKRYGLLTERTELSGVSQVQIVDDLGSDPGDG